MRKIHSFAEYKNRLEEEGLLIKQTGAYDGDIELLCCDSKKAGEKCMFVCKGNHFKPQYLYDAINAGAVCCVSETVYDADIPCLEVSDVRAALAVLADLYYGTPCNMLDLTAVTGTKGKTTVAYFIKALIDAHNAATGKKASGLVSTVDTFDGVTTCESVNSTPESIDLQHILRSCVDNGLTEAVVEVSSQALKYHRVKGIKFDTAVFTNIGEDHISPVEHPDFNDYFSSKLKLFSSARRAVINRECDHYEQVYAAADCCDTVITYGDQPDCTVSYSNVRKKGGKTRFTVKTPYYSRDMSLGMAGLFNVSNAAAAIAATLHYHIDPQTVSRVLEGISVSGRMETYNSKDGKVTAIVDYAHNAMSFENLFNYVKKEYPDRRIVSVFGSVGNKAEVRRYALGRIAGMYSDFVYITSEHPDYEDPRDIAAQIAAGVKDGGKAGHTVIVDRETAVTTAVSEAPDDTVVLILGVGNETTQRINGVLYERRSDSECALAALEERNKISV